jgi:predicted HD phosphohydrolase
MSDSPDKNRIVSFRRMQDGTREDYLLLEQLELEYTRQLPAKILAAVSKLDQSFDGYPVTRLGHSLQTATRAMRDGADEELIAAALIHDVGDELAPFSHQEIAATILRPYVREEVTWIVAHHALFQNYYYVHHLGGDRHARDRYKDHRWYGACRDFCANWDQNSFDPDYPNEPMSTFAPIIERIFSRPPHDPRYITGG